MFNDLIFKPFANLNIICNLRCDLSFLKLPQAFAKTHPWGVKYSHPMGVYFSAIVKSAKN